MRRFISCTVVGLCLIGASLSPVMAAPPYNKLNAFAEALERVHDNYVREISVDELIDKAIGGMLSGLDPHSSYMIPHEIDAMQASQSGVGLEVAVTDRGHFKVVDVIDHTPAAAAGIMSGDYIFAIDGLPVSGAPLSKVIDLLRGPEKSVVKLAILRAGAKKQLEFAISRAPIVVESVRSERRDNVGYIRIGTLDGETDELLKRAIMSLKTTIGAKLSGYVVDLRNNEGGLLDQAVAVSDQFLDSGNIVCIRGRAIKDTQRYDAHAGDLTNGKPIIVLINERSAAGAEIIAGALQDNKRATIIGMKSFGDGTIQTIIPLSGSNGALRLTTARVILPSGREIQATGLTPDIAVSQRPQPAADSDMPSGEAALFGHLFPGADSGGTDKPVIYPEAGKAYDDFQLAYALKVLSER